MQLLQLKHEKPTDLPVRSIVTRVQTLRGYKTKH